MSEEPAPKTPILEQLEKRWKYTKAKDKFFEFGQLMENRVNSRKYVTIFFTNRLCSLIANVMCLVMVIFDISLLLEMKETEINTLLVTII